MRYDTQLTNKTVVTMPLSTRFTLELTATKCIFIIIVFYGYKSTSLVNFVQKQSIDIPKFLGIVHLIGDAKQGLYGRVGWGR